VNVDVDPQPQRRELARRQLTLEPGRVVRLELAVPQTPLSLWVDLSDDALLLDNPIEVLPDPQRIVSVAVLLPEETQNLLQLPRVLAALPATRTVDDPAAADLVVTSGAGALAPGRCELVIATLPGDTDSWLGPFLTERRNDLLAGLTLEGVVWTAGRGPLAGLPLILAGSQPLLSLEIRQGGSRLWCNLDPARSNLASSPDWPILFANLIDTTRTELPGPGAVNLRIGELISFTHAGPTTEVATIALREPDGTLRPARGVRTLTFEARCAGRHVVEQQGRELARYAVHFVDAAESDLLGRGAGERPPDAGAVEPNAAATTGGGASERRLLALLLLLLVAADWWVVARAARHLGGGP
jgi:hypothetical protein